MATSEQTIVNRWLSGLQGFPNRLSARHSMTYQIDYHRLECWIILASTTSNVSYLSGRILCFLFWLFRWYATYCVCFSLYLRGETSFYAFFGAGLLACDLTVICSSIGGLHSGLSLFSAGSRAMMLVLTRFQNLCEKTLKSGRGVKFCRTDNNAVHRSPDLQQSTPSPSIIHHSYLSPLFRQSTSLIHSSKSLDPCLCPYIMQKYRNIYCNLDSLWHMFGRLYYVNGIKLKIISSG